MRGRSVASPRYDHMAKTAPTATRAPSPTRITPITRLNSTVRTPSFSAKIAIEMPPIQSKLIDPEMNKTSMNSQQQPMQYMEWRKPIRNAPRRPPRQWRSTNSIGDVHWERQTSFVRVTCQKPAESSRANRGGGHEHHREIRRRPGDVPSDRHEQADRASHRNREAPEQVGNRGRDRLGHGARYRARG